MEKLYVLGTGNAGALRCYNTCFALKKQNEFFLVDAGGGNQILTNLSSMNIDITQIHNVFVSHNHIDHIIGVVWIIRIISRMIRTSDKYMGNLNVYASDVTVNGLQSLCDVLLSEAQKRYIGDRIIFKEVKENEQLKILNSDITFIDIKARKDKQFGFRIELKNNEYLTFCGDEPCSKEIFEIAKNSKWLLHEAFCLDEEEIKFNSHEKGHCTVKEASQIANELNAQNLILWHTKDNNLNDRKKLYTDEAKQYFNGNIFVPNDLEIIDL